MFTFNGLHNSLEEVNFQICNIMHWRLRSWHGLISEEPSVTPLLPCLPLASSLGLHWKVSFPTLFPIHIPSVNKTKQAEEFYLLNLTTFCRRPAYLDPK